MGEGRHDNARRQSITKAIAGFAGAVEPRGRINLKTAAKWQRRAAVEVVKTAPTEPRLTVLTKAAETAIVAIRHDPRMLLCNEAIVQDLKQSAIQRHLQLQRVSHNFTTLFNSSARILFAFSEDVPLRLADLA